MTNLERIPVVVGGGQFTNRDEDPSSAPNPFELMAAAVKRAAQSAGSGKDWIGEASHCWMVHSISVRHGDPARELARRIGAPDSAETRCSGMGGNIPQWLVNRAADVVRGGARPVVVIAGAEALATRRRAKKAGVRLEWPSSEGWPDLWPALEPDMGVHPLEDEAGLRQATTMYALVESAIAHAAGRTPAENAKSIGEVMSGLNSVAVENEYSWFGERRDAGELMTVDAGNRMVNTPYPKYVNAVMDVDMSACVIVTDAATARSAGLGQNEVAYVRGYSDANEVWYLSQRREVDESPALERCVRRALGDAKIGLDEIDAFDLYACFPSSVEVSRNSFGITEDDARPLTVTGGLPYHGGPGSNYVTHAVCNALERVRAGGGPVAVHGNGYYLTKHAVGVYSSSPPGDPGDPGDGDANSSGAEPAMQAKSPDPEIGLDATASGEARIVAWTVPYDRDGNPEPAIVLADTAPAIGTATRTLARGDDDLTRSLLGSERDVVGDAIAITPRAGAAGGNGKGGGGAIGTASPA